MRWRMERANVGARAQEEPRLINRWPVRGETVLVLAECHRVPMRVADAFVIEAGACVFLFGYVTGSNVPHSCLVRRCELAVLANCPRCLGTWRSCTCSSC